jgi:hypothetical protein
MIFKLGKSYSEKEEALLDSMIPKQVFAWLPVPLGGNRFVWLRKVWSYSSFQRGRLASQETKFCLSEAEAIEGTKHDNIPHREDSFYARAIERLGKLK